MAGESVARQHRMVVRKVKRVRAEQRTKSWRLKKKRELDGGGWFNVVTPKGSGQKTLPDRKARSDITVFFKLLHKR